MTRKQLIEIRILSHTTKASTNLHFGSLEFILKKMTHTLLKGYRCLHKTDSDLGISLFDLTYMGKKCFQHF